MNSSPRIAKDNAPVKSGKQKKAELEAKRTRKRNESEAEQAAKEAARIAKNELENQKLIAAKKRKNEHVEYEKLKPMSAFRIFEQGTPGFMDRGYYMDIPFVCK